MSLFPAKTQGEGIWQYCNYGYDHNKYSSYADCMDKRCNEAGLGWDSSVPFGCAQKGENINEDWFKKYKRLELAEGDVVEIKDYSKCPAGGKCYDVPIFRALITGTDTTSRSPRYEVETENGDTKYFFEREIHSLSTNQNWSSDIQPLGLKPQTAGVGDNKLLIWFVVGGLALWYLNKEGYLKKILK